MKEKPNIRDFGQRSFVRTKGLVERIEKEERRMNEQELLAVLDMSEDEQYDWVYNWRKQDDIQVELKDCTFIHYASKEFRRMALSDLAFRLRNEVCKDSLSCDNYRKSLHLVYRDFRKSQRGTIRQNLIPYELWLESFVTSIERITAALIAKEKEDE